MPYDNYKDDIPGIVKESRVFRADGNYSRQFQNELNLEKNRHGT